MLNFYELAPSPNSIKVRMALRYKGVPFEATPVDGADRSEVRAVSGQDLTPVITAKGIVLNDSEAIINFLDANYAGPRLVPQERAGRKACDRWKERIDGEVARHWAPVFFYGIKVREDLDESARGAFQAALAALDAELGGRDSFHDDPNMAICDLRVAEWACYALPGQGLIARCPLFKRFAELFGVAPGSLPNLERFLEPWNALLA